MSSSWRRPMEMWLSSHLGVISFGTLIQLGCGERNVAVMVQRGELKPLLPGVYVSAQWPIGREQLLGAICARNPAALIAFTTAGQLWAMRKMLDSLIHVLVPHGHSPVLDGVVVHRCRRVDTVDIVERPDGIRLTSPPRTLFDSAHLIGESNAASVLEQLLNERRCTFETVADTVTRLYHPRRPGSAAMLAVIRSRPAWRTALQSGLEVQVLQEITRQRLPSPETQFRVWLPSGATISIDFAWPAQRVALEVDHPAWHDGAADSRRDKLRDRTLTLLGWAPLRICALDVTNGLTEAIADVGTVLRNRAA